jgi:predicted acyltransferase
MDNPGQTSTAPAPAPAIETRPAAAEKPGRLLSLDVFRGFTLAMMLIANNPGDWSHKYTPFEHAEWNGCTFTDLIFPSFVFIMGVAMTFSFARRLGDGSSKAKLFLQVIKRTIILIALGIGLAAFSDYTREHPGPKQLRFPGVLQRLALCYFFASLVLMSGLKARGQAAVAAILLIGYHLAMKYIPVPGYGPGVLERPGNLASFIDAKVFGTHAYTYIKEANTWHDPEGLLSTLPAIATALIGTITGYLVRDRMREGYDKVATMMVWGLALVVAGWLWNYSFPMNKNLWTSSFVLFAGGWSLLGLGACYWLTDMKRITWWTKPFIVLGTNAIFTYVTVGVATILSIIIKWEGPDGKEIALKTWLYENLIKSWLEPLAGPNAASLGYGIFYIAVWTALVWALLYRRRIFIRV